MKRKKGYNPFKMWGSYAILIVPLLAVLWASATPNCFSFAEGCGWLLFAFFPTYWLLANNYILWNSSGVIITYGGAIITWFLLGWGIHSLIRKLTKGKI